MVGIRHGFQSYFWNQNSLNNKKKLEDFPDVPVVKNPPCNAGTSVQSLVREDPKCCRATKPMCHNC